jgi:hypothetical protein
MSKVPDAVGDPWGYVMSQSGAIDRPPRPLVARKRFVPEEYDGDAPSAPASAMLSVDLGGERMRVVVRMVVDPDLVVIEVTGIPFTRNHTFRQGDFVPVARKPALLGEVWEAAARSAVDQTELARLAEERRKRLDSEKPPLATRRRRGER